MKVRRGWIRDFYGEEAASTIEKPKPGPLWTKAGLVLVSVAILAPSIFFYGWVVSPRFTSLPGPPVPENNGYLLLARAAEKLQATKFDPRAATDLQLGTFLAEHEEILKLTRQGLALPCRVPHEDSLIYIQMPFSMTRGDAYDKIENRKNSLRVVARLLTAEGSMLAREGRMEEAIDRYFETMLFGQAIAEGGLEIDFLVGLSYQGFGIESLRNDFDLLDDRQSEELLERLVEWEGQPFPTQDAMQRERAYFVKANDMFGRFIQKLFFYNDLGFYQGLNQRNLKINQAKLRLLMTHLAIRRFRMAHDQLPEFLPTLLEDPFNGQPLIYRLKEEGYLLYSVGSNGADDGGKIAGPNQDVSKVGDVVLDPVAKAGTLSGAEEADGEEGDAKP